MQWSAEDPSKTSANAEAQPENGVEVATEDELLAVLGGK